MTIDRIEESPKALLPFALKELTEDLKAKAKFELFESEDTVEHSVRLLRTLIKGEKDLFAPHDNEEFLKKFLRARKYDVQKTFTLCKNYFYIREKHCELYDNFQFSTIQKTMDNNFLGFLPYRDLDGSVILIIKAGKWDPMKDTLGEVMRTLTSGLIQAIIYSATQIAGFKVIVDFQGFGIKHLTNMSTNYIWLFAEALQNCFPARFRAVHVINENALWACIWTVLKQILNKKLRERFHFHGKSVRKLHKYVSPSVLPVEYAGDLEKFDNSHWIEKMQESSKHIAEMYSFGYRKET